MPKFFLFFLLCAVLCVFFLTAAKALTADDEDWTLNVIKEADRTFDFKTVAKGTKHEHRFVLYNPFEETLHIASVTSSCACTVPRLDGSSTDVMLGTYETAGITAQFNSDMFDGNKNAVITVVFDKPYDAEMQLRVRGDIRTDIAMKPAAMMLGQVPAGENHSRTLTITYTGQNTAWRILDCKSTSGHIRAEVTDEKVQVGKKTFQVKVVLDAKTPPGKIEEQLLLFTNDAQNRRELPVFVSATVGTVITISPSTVFLGTVNTTASKQVVLRCEEPFKITKITSSSPEVAVPIDIKPDAPAKTIYLLPVKYVPAAQDDKNADEIKALVKIETDLPDVSASFYVTGRKNK